jgi:hypothetical protein
MIKALHAIFRSNRGHGRETAGKPEKQRITVWKADAELVDAVERGMERSQSVEAKGGETGPSGGAPAIQISPRAVVDA